MLLIALCLTIALPLVASRRRAGSIPRSSRLSDCINPEILKPPFVPSRLLEEKPVQVPRRGRTWALSSARLGRYEQAISEYKIALRRLLRIPASDSISGSALYKADRFVEATQEFAAAHALAPGNKQIMLLLGDCYLRQGENRASY